MRRVLVLGGTGWLGGRIAEAALANGADVTCLARGRSGEVPAGARLVRADRGRPGAYDGLGGDWDEVVELSNDADHVAEAVELLAGRAAHWTFVSTVSVYRDHTVGGDESGDVVDAAEAGYPGEKVRAERACVEHAADRLLIVRPGLIVGSGDPSDRFGYWPARLARGGRVVTPNPDGRYLQVIDVDDLAAWIVHAGEHEHTGVIDAVGDPVAFDEFLTQLQRATDFTGDLEVVDDAWLVDRGVNHWSGPESLPLWLPAEATAMMRRSNAKFLSHGGALRRLVDTIEAVLADERRRGLTRRRRSGLSVDDERALLAARAVTWEDTAVGHLWDGQARFRRSLERVANDALDAAGVDLDPRAFVVGLPLSPDGAVRVEPQRGHFDRAILAQATMLANRRFNKILRDEDDELDDAHAAALESRTRRRAVADKLDAAARASGRIHFAGLGVTINDHIVFPVLALQADPWKELPQLPDDAEDTFLTARSFQEAVVTTVLDVASRELDRQIPGSIVRADIDAVLRTAADALVSAVVARTGQELAFGAMQAFDAVSAQPYESRASTGSVVLTPPDDAAVTRIISLEHPVPISRTRAFRKILELSDAELQLLCDGREVYGLGTLEPEAERFRAVIAGNGSWELWHGATPYLRVDNATPAMPRDLLDEDEFSVVVDRVFPEVSARNARFLWRIAKACSQQAHGTVLVVHPDAEAEKDRLLPQAYAIAPTRLSDRALEAATGIDGAVLVSPDGRCHAVGVILDGLATGTGDPARGARFSSAIRYLAGAGKGAMVIIVSEDGRIDLLPKSKRRVRRATVQRAVDRLVAASRGDDDPEAFVRANRAVEEIEFYLHQGQCDAVNAAREAVEGREWGEARVRRQYIPVAPDPAMDDSYFIDRLADGTASEGG